MPDEGSSTRRMKGFSAASSVLLALCLFVLGGCAEVAALDIFPFNINGREGAQALDYDTLMRVGAAARAGGDLPNAVAIYRRAAVVTPSAPAPFVAAGNTLLEMGEIN